MKWILWILPALLLLPAAPSGACFGPKLYLGGGTGIEGDVLSEMVVIYVKEKTGAEVVRVDTEGREPMALLREEKLDFAFALEGEGESLLNAAGLPVLIAGDRPLHDLQFTTVVPALRKLGGLLRAEHVSRIAADVESGLSPAAAVRRFLMENGWI